MAEAPPLSPNANVLQIGERLVEAPSRELTRVAFASELQAQLGLTEAISWADLAHVLCLAKSGLIPVGDARALAAALLELSNAASTFAPSAESG